MLSRSVVQRHCQTYSTFTSIGGTAKNEGNSDEGSPLKQSKQDEDQSSEASFLSENNGTDDLETSVSQLLIVYVANGGICLKISLEIFFSLLYFIFGLTNPFNLDVTSRENGKQNIF